jgi:predicted outer membrane protein
MNFLDQLLQQSELTMENTFEIEKTRIALNHSSHMDVVEVAIQIYSLYLRQRNVANWLIKLHQEGELYDTTNKL